MTTQIPAAERCSQQWRRDDLPAWGTASRADFWIALEQPGPWGAKALTESHLDPELGKHLEETCSDAGGRAVLIRRPGRHVDTGDGPFTVFIAGGIAAGRPWLGRTQLQSHYDVMELLSLEKDLGHASLPEWLTASDPILAVCTNARRDQCCALEGRQLLAHLAEDDRAEDELAARLWEVSHLGGHRFAATALVLPTGQSLARVDVDQARAALDAAALGLPLAAGALHDRGLGHLPGHLQVADAWARAQHLPGVRPGAEAEQVDADTWQVRLSGHSVRVARSSGPDELTSSCGKDVVPVERWSLTESRHG